MQTADILVTQDNKNHRFEKLETAILEKSENKIWTEAKREWRFNRVFIQDTNCACGQAIMHACVIVNTKNNEEMIVGSDCLERFTGLDYSDVFDNLVNVVKRGSNFTECSRDYLFEKALINGWERDFLANVQRRRKLTPNQVNKLNLIKTRIINQLVPNATPVLKEYYHTLDKIMYQHPIFMGRMPLLQKTVDLWRPTAKEGSWQTEKGGIAIATSAIKELVALAKTVDPDYQWCEKWKGESWLKEQGVRDARRKLQAACKELGMEPAKRLGNEYTYKVYAPEVIAKILADSKNEIENEADADE